MFARAPHLLRDTAADGGGAARDAVDGGEASDAVRSARPTAAARPPTAVPFRYSVVWRLRSLRAALSSPQGGATVTS